MRTRFLSCVVYAQWSIGRVICDRVCVHDEKWSIINNISKDDVTESIHECYVSTSGDAK